MYYTGLVNKEEYDPEKVRGFSPPFTKGQIRMLNRYLYHPRGERYCSECEAALPLTEQNFGIHRYYRDAYGAVQSVGYDSVCKKCMVEKRSKHAERIRSDYKWYCKKLLSQLRHRAKKDAVPFNLTLEDLIHEYEAQDGRCRYTGKVLDFTLKNIRKGMPHRDFPSLDRKIPSRGYVLGNVDWVTYGVNRMKNDFSEEEFISFCHLVSKRESV